MYLLDTPVIAELGRAKSGKANPRVARWVAGVASQNLFISALSLLELEGGAAQAERRDRASGAALRAWAEETVPKAFDGRILSVDLAVARKRAALPFHEPRSDRDAVLAATALTHGLTLVTHNPSAFRFARLKLFDPWSHAAPEDTADWQTAARSGPDWFKNLFLRF
ncbi:MAG TPA: type II toxin-antitoxin system VapC family toxin [Asticcacaulis sp.]|nr:type II toxin-antitoxin system VapC family toxin [Asticcacaulis sp.]